MSEYEVGDIIDTSEVPLNRFNIRGENDADAAEKLRIVEVPSKGKPIAIIEEFGDRTGSSNDLLGGHL